MTAARPRPRMRQGGFSLVEVLCAILILGVSLVGMVEGITASLSATKESEILTTAALLASGKMETLRCESVLKDGSEDGDWGKGFSAFRFRQTIAATEHEGLHDVTVSVLHGKSSVPVYELRTMIYLLPLSRESEAALKDKKAKSGRAKRGGGT